MRTVAMAGMPHSQGPGTLLSRNNKEFGLKDHEYLCMCIYMHICRNTKYINEYIYIYVYICIYMYIYIYIRKYLVSGPSVSGMHRV